MEASNPMSLTRSRWVVPALSACTAAAMFASPIAWADDDKGRGGGDHRRGDDDARRVTVLVQSPAQTVVVQRRDDDDENEDRDERAVVLSVTPLVNAINNEVANLMNREVKIEDQDEDEDEDEVENEDVEVEDVDFNRVVFISLGTLETGLSSADITAVNTAVNNNKTALLNFLNNGTALSNAIRTAITTAATAAGVPNITENNLSNLQAVLLGRGHRLIVVTP